MIILAWTLLACAAAMVFWALLRDWARQRRSKRRRCPKCWYDMSATPGLTCSECGHSARRERALFRSRRRWGWLVVGILILPVAHLSGRARDIREHGWMAAAPTTALVLIVPMIDVDRIAYLVSRRRSDGFAAGTIGALGLLELERRIRDGDLTSWQSELVVEQCIGRGARGAGQWYEWRAHSIAGQLLWYIYDAGHLTDVGDLERAVTLNPIRIVTRRRWPLGETIYGIVIIGPHFGCEGIVAEIEFRGPQSFKMRREWRELGLICRLSEVLACRGGWVDDSYPIGVATDGLSAFAVHSHVDVEVANEVVSKLGRSRLSWDQQQSIPVEVTSSVDDILTPVRSDSLNQAIADQIDPHIAGVNGLHIHLAVDEIADELHALGDVTFAVDIELLLDGVVEARGFAWWVAEYNETWKDYFLSGGSRVNLDADNEEALLKRCAANDCDLEIRIRSNPILALRNFDCDRYWQGELTLPATLRPCDPL